LAYLVSYMYSILRLHRYLGKLTTYYRYDTEWGTGSAKLTFRPE
jgi:hypothetical protein